MSQVVLSASDARSDASGVVCPPSETLCQHTVDAAVAHIRAVQTRHALQAALEIGRYVLDTFFEGNLSNYKSSMKRHVTFRALAMELVDVGVSHVWLSTSVRVVAQYAELPGAVRDRLPLSHHRLLLPIENTAKKTELAQRAVAQCLSKREFTTLIRGTSASETRRSGRPPLPPVVKGVRQLGRVIRSVTDVDVTERLPDDQALEALETLNDAIEQLQALQAELKARLD